MNILTTFAASSYVLENGVCTVDGVIQDATTRCDDIGKAFLGFGLGLILLFLVLFIIFLVFFILAMVHVISHKDVEHREFWIAGLIISLFIGLSWILVIVYYFAVMRPYKKTHMSVPIPQQQSTTVQAGPIVPTNIQPTTQGTTQTPLEENNQTPPASPNI